MTTHHAYLSPPSPNISRMKVRNKINHNRQSTTYRLLRWHCWHWLGLRRQSGWQRREKQQQTMETIAAETIIWQWQQLQQQELNGGDGDDDSNSNGNN